MSQLIVVIISIVLSIMLSMTGIYYLGNTIMDSKDKATALQYVAQGTQISSAWRAWSKAHGTRELTQLNWIQTKSSSDLVPNYLSELPRTPRAVANHETWLPMALENYGVTGAAPNIQSTNAPVTGVIAWLPATKEGSRLCRQIVQLSQGTSAAPAVLGLDIRPRGNALFDCYYDDANASAAVDAAETKIMVQRVF